MQRPRPGSSGRHFYWLVSCSGASAAKFEIDSSFGIEAEHVPASGSCPLCRHDDEHAQEALEPRGPVKPFDPSTDDIEKVQVEVLEDGSGDEEHGVLLQKGERHVRPAEVVVLAVEVALACAPPVVVRDDVAFGAVPVVRDDAAVYVFGSEDAFRLRVRIFIGDGRALYHKPQVHIGQHSVKLEGGDTALPASYFGLRPVLMLHELGIS